MKKSLIIAFVALLALAAFLFWRSQTPAPEGGEPAKDNLAASAPEGVLPLYTDSVYGFSFRYPADWNIQEIGSGEEGQTLLLRGPEANQKQEFQIAVSPFDENGEAMTAERIQQDNPDMVIEDSKEVLIGKDKSVRALIFVSQSESLGRTREVWFVHPVRSQSPEATADPQANRTSNGVNGLLFQITGYEGTDSIIGPILETLSFE